MKQTLVSLLAIAALMFVPACKTTSPETIAAIAAATQIAVKDGTYLYTQAHPETRERFQVAANTLRVLSTSETLNFSTALNVLQQLPIKEIQDPVVRLIIADADIILTYLGVNVPLTEVEHLRPIVVAMAQGIEDGLAMDVSRAKTTVSARPVSVTGRDGKILKR